MNEIELISQETTKGSKKNNGFFEEVVLVLNRETFKLKRDAKLRLVALEQLYNKKGFLRTVLLLIVFRILFGY